MICDISVAFWLFSGLVMAGFWSCYQNKWKISLRRITNHSPNHPFQPRKKMVQLPFPFTDSFSLPMLGVAAFSDKQKTCDQKTKKNYTLPETNMSPLKKMVVGRRSFRFLLGPHLFSGAQMLVSGRVYRAKNDKKHNPSNLQSFRGILCSV